MTEEQDNARLYDANAYMADGEITMTAAEDVLAWLLIEKIGMVDDCNYTPAEARDAIAARLDMARQLEEIDAMLFDGQGDDEGAQILPDFGEGWTVAAKIEACLHLLEVRRDIIFSDPAGPADPA